MICYLSEGGFYNNAFVWTVHDLSTAVEESFGCLHSRLWIHNHSPAFAGATSFLPLVRSLSSYHTNWDRLSPVRTGSSSGHASRSSRPQAAVRPTTSPQLQTSRPAGSPAITNMSPPSTRLQGEAHVSPGTYPVKSSPGPYPLMGSPGLSRPAPVSGRGPLNYRMNILETMIESWKTLEYPGRMPWASRSAL